MKVKICGIPHKIVKVQEHLDVVTCFGMIDHKKAEIRINRDITPDLQKETICHEVLHGIFVHIGREDLSNDEGFIQCLASAINQSFDVRLEDDE